MTGIRRVALVFPYFRTRSANEILFPPLGEASLAAQLKRLGVEVRVFDGTFLTPARLERQLADYRPEIVGVYVMISLSRNAFRLADWTRTHLPGSLLVAGGPLPTLYPERYAAAFDAVFRGESDLSFPAFCRDYLAAGLTLGRLGELDGTAYPGLFVRRERLAIETPETHHTEAELAAFPLPDRGDFDHAAYQAVWTAQEGWRTTSLLTTLGCPFQCDFCSRPIFGSRFRRRPLDPVFAEIEQVRGLGDPGA